MMTNQRRRDHRLALLFATAALALGASPARAQWDFPWIGFGGFNYVPSPTEYLNQRSLIAAQTATRGPVQNNVYANNPNAYFNRSRDNGLTPHFSRDTRSSPSRQLSRSRQAAAVTPTSNVPPRPAPAAAPAVTMPAVAQPVVPIGSFFDASRRLVWPADAPAGDLLAKRDVSDQASLLVADLVHQHGSAPITTVTTARKKLVAYGQPAYALLQGTTTPRVSESFHTFLMSLYESLGQAANPPTAP